MTKADLVEKVAREADMTKKDAERRKIVTSKLTKAKAELKK